ncbi:MAG: endonuclease/exonuclease/phosphatase family protein [Myxococcota bacterium]
MRFILTSYNVRYFSQASHGLHAGRRTMRGIAEALAEQFPDVVALQEVESQSLRGGFGHGPQLSRFVSHFRDVTGESGWTAHYVPVHRYGVGTLALYTTGLGVLVGPRFTAGQPYSTDVTHVRWPIARPLKQRRRVMILPLQAADGARVTVANVHLSLPAFFEGTPWTVIERMGEGSNQRREATQLVDALTPMPDPAVLCGDLNAAPRSPVIDQLCASGWHHETAETPPTAVFFHRTMAIDHLFTSPSVRVERLHVPRIQASNWSKLSDHAPITATLEVGHGASFR